MVQNVLKKFKEVQTTRKELSHLFSTIVILKRHTHFFRSKPAILLVSSLLLKAVLYKAPHPIKIILCSSPSANALTALSTF